MSTVVALDIGGTHSRIAQFDNNQIVWRSQAPTPAQAGPEAMLATMIDLLNQAPNSQAPIGVAMAGTVANGCVTAHNTGLLQGWNEFPLAETLKQRLKRPVTVVNDARAAAWAEYLFGAGRGCPAFMFVTVSSGVGAGLVLNGRLHLAGNGMDAELGETLLPDGQTLENLASGTALGQQAKVLGYTSTPTLFDAAEAGEAKAAAAVQAAIRALALKLADLSVLLGIARSAIGGGVGLRPGYLAQLRSALQELPAIYQHELLQAELGADAGLFGAAALARAPEPSLTAA